MYCTLFARLKTSQSLTPSSCFRTAQNALNYIIKLSCCFASSFKSIQSYFRFSTLLLVTPFRSIHNCLPLAVLAALYKHGLISPQDKRATFLSTLVHCTSVSPFLKPLLFLYTALYSSALQLTVQSQSCRWFTSSTPVFSATAAGAGEDSHIAPTYIAPLHRSAAVRSLNNCFISFLYICTFVSLVAVVGMMQIFVYFFPVTMHCGQLGKPS